MDRWVRQSAEHFFSSSIFFVFFLFCFRIVCFIVRMHVGRVACVITCCYDASFSLALKWNAIPPMRTTGYWSSTCMRNVCATVRLSDCACGYEREPCRSLWMLGWCESFPLNFLWIAFSVQCDGHNINLFYTQTFSVFIFLFRLLSVVSQHDISYRPMWSDLWVTASYAYDKMPFLLLLIAERKMLSDRGIRPDRFLLGVQLAYCIPRCSSIASAQSPSGQIDNSPAAKVRWKIKKPIKCVRKIRNAIKIGKWTTQIRFVNKVSLCHSCPYEDLSPSHNRSHLPNDRFVSVAVTGFRSSARLHSVSHKDFFQCVKIRWVFEIARTYILTIISHDWARGILT